MKLLQDYLSYRTDLAGIYRIDCLTSGKFYIGSSNSLYKRYMDHISYLRRGCHCNTILQRSYDKYGADNFTYRVLAILPDKDRGFIYDIEQKFLDAYSPELNILDEVGKPVAACKEIACYTIEGVLVEILPSLTEAASKYNTHSTGIRKSTMDPWRICAGHRWRYVENGVADSDIGHVKDHLPLSIGDHTVSRISWQYGDYTIYQWTKEGTLLRTWDSIEDVMAYIGKGSAENLREHLRGRINSYFGFVWSMTEEFPGFKPRGLLKRKALTMTRGSESIQFASFSDAGKYFSVTPKAISQAKRRGYMFRGWSIELTSDNSDCRDTQGEEAPS